MEPNFSQNRTKTALQRIETTRMKFRNIEDRTFKQYSQRTAKHENIQKLKTELQHLKLRVIPNLKVQLFSEKLLKKSMQSELSDLISELFQVCGNMDEELYHQNLQINNYENIMKDVGKFESAFQTVELHFRNQLEMKDSEIQRLNELIEAKETQIKNINQINGDLEVKHSELIKHHEMKELEISILKDLATIGNNEIDDYKENFLRKECDIEELQEKLRNMETKYRKLKTKDEQKEKLLIHDLETISRLNNKILALKNQLGFYKSKVDKVHTILNISSESPAEAILKIRTEVTQKFYVDIEDTGSDEDESFVQSKDSNSDRRGKRARKDA